ncbi:MAG: hypothetical protein J6Y82_01935 [Bacteroidales bacterium]|nr:hypothetical protein [Bacteroidales bacterium]
MRTLVYIMIVALATIAVSCGAPKSQIPQSLVGCWLNDTTQDWELGLFEDFAIYRNDCWDYASVGGDAANADIVLTHGNKKVNLSINSLTDSTLAIAVGKAAPHRYMRHTSYYLHYTHPDTTRLETVGLATDTATVIIYGRNTLKGIVSLLFRFQQFNSQSLTSNDPFGCKWWVPGAPYRKSQFGKCDIVRVPVNGLCLVDGLPSPNGKMLLQPGDTLVVFVNVDDTFSRLHMGKYGRLNNELFSFGSNLQSKYDTIEPRVFFEQKMYENSGLFDNREYSSRYKDFITNDLKYKMAEKWLGSIVGDSLADANEITEKLLPLMPTIDDIALNNSAARFASRMYKELSPADDSNKAAFERFGVNSSVIEFCFVADCINKMPKEKTQNSNKPLDTKPLEQMRQTLSPEFSDIARQITDRLEKEIYYNGPIYSSSSFSVNYDEDSLTIQ